MNKVKGLLAKTMLSVLSLVALTGCGEAKGGASAVKGVYVYDIISTGGKYGTYVVNQLGQQLVLFENKDYMLINSLSANLDSGKADETHTLSVYAIFTAKYFGTYQTVSEEDPDTHDMTVHISDCTRIIRSTSDATQPVQDTDSMASDEKSSYYTTDFLKGADVIVNCSSFRISEKIAVEGKYTI